MSADLVTLEVREGIADVRLNRAEKYNALSPEMFSAIHLAGEKLLERSWHADEQFGLELEETLQRQLIGTPNQVEAITANFENRAPNFSDPE